MIDLDDALRADGRQWRTRVGDPADLDQMVATALEGTQHPGRRRLVPWLAAAAVAALVVAIAVLYPRGESSVPATRSAPVPPAGVAPSVVVDGKPVPYAGRVPWVNAISDPANPRRLFVFADNDRIESPQFVCGVTADRVVVSESASQVHILVAGYARPLPPGISCASVGHAPVRAVVTLRRPLGNRQLIDVTNGSVHRVLDAATVPAVHLVPQTCTAGPLTWTEQGSVAERRYFSQGRSGCYVELRYGPARSVRALNPAHDGVTICPPMKVGRALAQCWYFDDRYRGTGYTLRWIAKPGFAVLLDVTFGGRGNLSRAQVSAVAASVR